MLALIKTGKRFSSKDYGNGNKIRFPTEFQEKIIDVWMIANQRTWWYGEIPLGSKVYQLDPYLILHKSWLIFDSPEIDYYRMTQ